MRFDHQDVHCRILLQVYAGGAIAVCEIKANKYVPFLLRRYDAANPGLFYRLFPVESGMPIRCCSSGGKHTRKRIKTFRGIGEAIALSGLSSKIFAGCSRPDPLSLHSLHLTQS